MPIRSAIAVMCYMKHKIQMYLIQLGQQLRALRKSAGLTQAQLAQLAGLARETVSRIENGTYNDLGFKKVATLLELVGAQLAVAARQSPSAPDFVKRAVSTANVSLRNRLYADELIQALVTGTVPPGKAAHLQAIYEDLSTENRTALIDQVAALAGNQAKVRAGAKRLRERLASQS